jgi:hypothetical protein
VYPVLQVHVNDPGASAHAASLAHECSPAAHSSTLLQPSPLPLLLSTPLPVYPALHVQL